VTAAADLVIRASRIVSGEGESAGLVVVSGGRIASIEPLSSNVRAKREICLQDGEVLLSGLVDTHVHICDPGHADWEGFDTATMAAAAGGITTLVDMPLDSVPVTVTAAALEAKLRAAHGRCHVDVGFWAGVIPGNLGDLADLHRAGVLGFKCFLADTGSDDFPRVSAGEMTEALRQLCDLGSPLLVHAESPAAASLPAASGRRYADYLASRPRGLENLAIAQVIEAARATRGHAHIVHLSSSDALPMLASARRDGVPVSVETCPHYLAIAAEEIGDGQTAFKCSPPIREAANRELLWQGLQDQIIDLIASDHSPCTPQMKHLDTGDFGAAWGGISSLQLALPVVWTQARNRGHGLAEVATWMAERPARLAGLARKGRISAGCDADFCVFAPDEEFTVDASRLHHRHPVTPYQGRRLYGVVRATFLRGRLADSRVPRGQFLFRAGRMEGAAVSAA
jgi:allantoinase